MYKQIYNFSRPPFCNKSFKKSYKIIFCHFYSNNFLFFFENVKNSVDFIRKGNVPLRINRYDSNVLQKCCLIKTRGKVSFEKKFLFSNSKEALESRWWNTSVLIYIKRLEPSYSRMHYAIALKYSALYRAALTSSLAIESHVKHENT